MNRLSIAFLLLLAGQTSWAFDPFGAFGKALQEAAAPAAQPSSRNEPPPANAEEALAQAGHRRVVYEGYSATLLPIKEKIHAGKLDQALKALRELYKDPAGQDLLAHLQLGLATLDHGETKEAIDHFTQAERKMVAEKETGTVTGFFKGTKNTLLATISGNEELGDYPGLGYERVLMLNYKSIAYMLQGERKAYNVTRRAIDLQNIEKKKFDRLIQEAKEEIAKEEREQKRKGVDLKKSGLDAIIEEQYQATEKRARKVPSAFVNPFGFYIAGVVQELDSYDDRSLRGNARISYQKALELNPKSAVIKQAIKAVKRSPPRNRRLVHVIVGDGFAPEKKLIKFDLTLGRGLPTEIELPIFSPVPSKVHRVEVRTTTGRRWARLSEVADITALALRYQKDAGPLMQLRMMTTVIRNLIESEVWNQTARQAGLFGGLFLAAKKERDKMAHPDMRSWSLLPSRLLAARFYVPKSVSRIKVVSYDRKGRVLASKVVPLDKKSHNLVYVRTLDKTMYTLSSDTLWTGR